MLQRIVLQLVLLTYLQNLPLKLFMEVISPQRLIQATTAVPVTLSSTVSVEVLAGFLYVFIISS
jgi:hypothetical protein